jgi:hypothetical protein
MVILIGGSANTGKTLLAHHFMVKYGITYLSIDHLKMGLFRGDPDCGFTPTDDWFGLGEKLWPIVKGIIMTNVENRQNITVEGCYLLPHLVNGFGEPYSGHIVSVFIGFSEHYIRNNYATAIALNRSAVEDKEEYDDLATMLDDHHKLRTACNQSNSTYFEITSDYKAEMNAVFRFVEQRINAEKGTFKTAVTYC